MKLCDICSFRGSKCDVQKFGVGTCCCRFATVEVWKPMDKEVPFGVPVIAAKVGDKNHWPPMPVMITVFGKYAVSWPFALPFVWDSRDYVAWCSLADLKVDFD